MARPFFIWFYVNQKHSAAVRLKATVQGADRYQPDHSLLVESLLLRASLSAFWTGCPSQIRDSVDKGPQIFRRQNACPVLLLRPLPIRKYQQNRLNRCYHH